MLVTYKVILQQKVVVYIQTSFGTLRELEYTAFSIPYAINRNYCVYRGHGSVEMNPNTHTPMVRYYVTVAVAMVQRDVTVVVLIYVICQGPRMGYVKEKLYLFALYYIF